MGSSVGANLRNEKHLTQTPYFIGLTAFIDYVMHIKKSKNFNLSQALNHSLRDASPIFFQVIS